MAGFLGLAAEPQSGRFIRDAARFLVILKNLPYPTLPYTGPCPTLP